MVAEESDVVGDGGSKAARLDPDRADQYGSGMVFRSAQIVCFEFARFRSIENSCNIHFGEGIDFNLDAK
jgi:hypothetical protein